MDDSAQPVSVRWAASQTGDEALRHHVGQFLGVAPATVRTGRLCARCGSDAHGHPWAGGGVYVSIARAGDHLLTAVSGRSPVGVDVESIAEVARRWDPDLVLHADEDAVTDEERAALWCRKEAILKMTGTGLAKPMSALRTADFAVRGVRAPQGYVAALAVDRSDYGQPG